MKISELNTIFRKTGLFQSGGLVIIKTIYGTNQNNVAQKIAGLFCKDGEVPEDIHFTLSPTCDNKEAVMKTLREIRNIARDSGAIMFYHESMNKNRFPDDVNGYFSRHYTSLRIDNEADMSVFVYEDVDGISIFIDKFRTLNPYIGAYTLRRIKIEE